MTDDLAALFHEENPTPNQFNDLRRPVERRPELRLWARVLEDALMCAQKGIGTERLNSYWRKEYDLAADWFADESMGVGSFLFVCDILNLDVDAVLDRLLADQIGKVEKRR